ELPGPGVEHDVFIGPSEATPRWSTAIDVHIPMQSAVFGVPSTAGREVKGLHEPGIQFWSPPSRYFRNGNRSVSQEPQAFQDVARVAMSCLDGVSEAGVGDSQLRHITGRHEALDDHLDG